MEKERFLLGSRFCDSFSKQGAPWAGGGANAAGVRDSPRTGAHSSLTVRCLVASSVPSCVQEGHFAYKHVSQTCSWEFLWWRLFCFFANTKAKAEQNQSPSWR